jgi:predicted Rdx family selenoprotein
LAAAIENEFGITAELIEGHNAIYEVALNGNTVYTNRGEAGRLPEDEDILQKLRKLTDPRPERDMSKNKSEEEPPGPSGKPL